MGIFLCQNNNSVTLSPNYINLIWIDPKMNNDEKTAYQKALKKIAKLHCFENIKNGINCPKTIKFEKIVIIISGRISKEFYQELKNNINEIVAIPKIIIFTRNSKNLSKKMKNLKKFL